MNLGLLILLASIGSVVSLSGGMLLLMNSKFAFRIEKLIAPFAAGALLSAVFFDLLPEAIEYSDKSADQILAWSFAGIAVFFFLERRLKWFHHHEHSGHKTKNDTLPSMLVIGDTLHNMIDGAAIAFAYLVAPSVGVVTTIAVAFHELPQEIGDFGLLLKSGWRRKKIVYANIFSALGTVITAVIVFYFGQNFEDLVAPALALSAGMLLYIALSDVLPSIHDNHPTKRWFDSANILFISGAAVVYAAIYIAGLIEA